MRRCLLSIGVGLYVAHAAAGQLPPPAARPPQPFQPPPPLSDPRGIQVPRFPVTQPAARTSPGNAPVMPAAANIPAGQAGLLPPGFFIPNVPSTPAPTQPGVADGAAPPPPADAPLAYPEALAPLDTATLMMNRTGGGWQVTAGRRLLKDFGNAEADAREAVRVLRELHVTEWATIGSPRPVVEYGLVNGRPPVTSGFPRVVLPIDLNTVKVESVKGVWCLRDDDTILFNFGPHRADAEQALAVVRKYGFNRVGQIGYPVPALSYLYVTLEADRHAKAPFGPLGQAAQTQALTRTGIAVPGAGYVGELVKFDARRVEVRKEKYSWVLAHGADVFADFGPSEWTARDALRVVQEGRFTEWGRFAGVTFFLTDGKAPTRVPFSARGRAFNAGELRVQAVNGRTAVTEAGRPLFECGTPEEGEQLVALLKHYGFDQLCQVGMSPKASLRFLGKSR